MVVAIKMQPESDCTLLTSPRCKTHMIVSTSYQCTWCGTKVSQDGVLTTCECGKPLKAVFDWGATTPDRNNIAGENNSLWRYRAVLPPIENDHIVSLHEGWTPMINGVIHSGVSVLFKDESVNPTGSFKDRGMTMAVSHAKRSGITELCLPSAGNAGVSAAIYCDTAGITCHVFLPETIPAPFVEVTEKSGADLRLGGRTIADAAAKMRESMGEGWFDLSTLKEPFRVEGKKTLGYEIAEQLDWSLPDAIVYPTGGGTGLVGMWKAFNEMSQLGWIDGPAAFPRMVVAQSDGCAPIVKAFADGSPQHEPWVNSHTDALGLNVPAPLGGAWILKTVRESNGMAVMVDENKVMDATAEVNDLSGIDGSCEAGVSWLTFKTLVEAGWIKKGERVVIPITGGAERYVLHESEVM